MSSLYSSKECDLICIVNKKRLKLNLTLCKKEAFENKKRDNFLFVRQMSGNGVINLICE